MVMVVAVTAFMLHRKSPLVAAGSRLAVPNQAQVPHLPACIKHRRRKGSLWSFSPNDFIEVP